MASSRELGRRRAPRSALRTAMRRAGADFIFTYHALEAVDWLK